MGLFIPTDRKAQTQRFTAAKEGRMLHHENAFIYVFNYTNPCLLCIFALQHTVHVL